MPYDIRQRYLGWCVKVGKGTAAYIMDNRVFDTKRDAITYRASQGNPPWSKDWHIIKIGEVK